MISLLALSGLGALQSAAIITGLPFCFVLILVCVGLARGLGEEGTARSEAWAKAPVGGESG